MVVEPNDESQVLNKSFAELDIFTENTTDVVWNLVSNFKQRPYETTLEAFSKLTDIGKWLRSSRSSFLVAGNESILYCTIITFIYPENYKFYATFA